MSKLNKIVYLSEEQKDTLFQNNSITVNGKTITYNDNDLYLTPLTIVTGVTDNILHGTSSETEITYAPYTSQQNKLSFDTSTSAPTGIDRLNLNGYLYATKLYSGGQEVLTADQPLDDYKLKQTVVSELDATNESTTATRFVYSITQDDNGVISAKTRLLPTYNDYVLPTATNNNLGGIKTGYSTSSTSDKNYAIKVDSNGNAYVNVPWEDTHQDISGKVSKSGDTMTGALTLYNDPTSDLHAATKRYVDNILTTNDALLFKGVLGSDTASGMISSLPPTEDEPEYKQGWVYKVGTAGEYAGQQCEIGDTIYCIADGTTANNANWTVIQTNIDGYVFGPTDTTTGIIPNSIALFTGTTGKAIKDSKVLIDGNNNLIPNVSDSYSIGSISKVWKNIYLGDNGLSFIDTEETKLKSSIYHNNNDLYLETNNGNIALKLTTTAVDDNINNTTSSGVVISNTATSIQTEGTITLQKNNESRKSVSLVFDDTINALNFVFTEEDQQ